MSWHAYAYAYVQTHWYGIQVTPYNQSISSQSPFDGTNDKFSEVIIIVTTLMYNEWVKVTWQKIDIIEYMGRKSIDASMLFFSSFCSR